MKFSDLDLIPPILKAAGEAGYETPSPIQQKAIPPVLAGRDLLGCAQTGTGKTAAFAMPILQRLSARSAQGAKGVCPIRALVLTPTRELALQIDECFAAYGRHLPLRHCVIFGGVNQNPQVAQLKKGVDILTATPGRLNDLIGQGHIDLSGIEIFVLDEADRMLDMGFVNDVKRVLRYLPAQRQTLLFSATMPKEIEALAGRLLHQPEKVMVAPPSTTVERIEQSVYFVDKGNKRHLLAKLLKQPEVTSALVFTRTKHGADRVVRELSRTGIEAMAIHGNKSQNARQTALSRFKSGEIRVLVATDIAARGIDVNGLSHVFNYDLPNIPETYVHRIGRTARAGRDGVAVSFCDCSEKEYLADIEKLTRIHIPVVEHEWPMQITQEETPAPRTARTKAPAGKQKPSAPERVPQKAREQQSEERQMNEANAPQRAPKDENAAAEPAKRRRRGGRHHKKASPEAKAAPAAQNAEKAKPQPAEKKKAPQGKKPEAKAAPAKKDRAEPARGKKPRDAERPARSERAERAPRREKEEDTGIRLISRRAPAQKYANFEEYMKAQEE